MATSTTTTTTASQPLTIRVPGGHELPEYWKDAGLDLEWYNIWNAHGGYHRQAEDFAIEEVRKNPKAYSFTHCAWTGPPVESERNLEIPVTRPAGSIKIRIYTPKGFGPFPVHLNYHGGGWILGNLESEAAWCRSICSDAGIIVVDVDYRLAPEFVFPTAIHDSWDAVKWVLAHATEYNMNADSVSVGGLSAGGHMAAVMSHFARDEGVKLKLALMVVPSTDFRWLITEEPLRSEIASQYPSTSLYRDAPWGGLRREQWFLDYWIPEGIRAAARKDWIASPMLAESFNGLPPTHVITAEFDICRDEAHRYADLLEEHGNTVTRKCYKGVPHAFGHYSHPQKGLSKSREYIKDTCRTLREAHSV